MTRPDLDAIRARCEAATPGTWHVVTVTFPNGNTIVESIVGMGKAQLIEYDDGDSEWFAERVEIAKTDGGHYGPERPDAEFIAAARTDIPALLRYIDELERRLKEIGAQVDELREQYDSVLEANVQAMDGRPWRYCK